MVAAFGLVIEAVLSGTVIGAAAVSLVFVTGVAIGVPAMITLFGETAAPNRAAGGGPRGFVLFLSASLGPMAAAIGWRRMSNGLLFTGKKNVIAVDLRRGRCSMGGGTGNTSFPFGDPKPRRSVQRLDNSIGEFGS